jgi:hypothetical protein
LYFYTASEEIFWFYDIFSVIIYLQYSVVGPHSEQLNLNSLALIYFYKIHVNLTARSSRFLFSREVSIHYI